MPWNIEINVKSVLGSIAILSFIILIVGIIVKQHYPNIYVPDSVFVAASILLGFIISMGIYATTDLQIIPSFLIGFIPSFIILGFVTVIGWILLSIELLIILMLVLLWVGSHGL